jgi:Cd2+/Zn2+-exporting ATPase
LIFVPPLLGIGHHRAGAGLWTGWFYQAMAFLTAASPCALAIGTPAAVLCGIARSARMGVLMKGGAHLENLGRVAMVAFDKTGTLTTGKPTVTDLVPMNGSTSDSLLALAASIERESNHPLARAIVASAEARQCMTVQADEIQQIPGQGMRGRVAGSRVAAGQLGLLAESQRNDPSLMRHVDELTRAGKTIVAVAVDDRCMGLIALADRPRENAPQALSRLRRIGVRRSIMLTGDHRQAAEAIGAEVGVDEVFAELLPEEKLGLIRRQIEQYGPVAMVGDGVNDAPALAYASVGIAMGGASADVAMETADVVLMSSDLEKLPEAIALSRFSRRIIQQNLLIALGVIAVMAPVAALGLAPLGVAVLLHEGSTVVVVLNSLRLLAHRDGSRHAAVRPAFEEAQVISAARTQNAAIAR